MRLHDVSEFVEESSALGSRGVMTPYGVEGLLGSGNSKVDLLGGTLRHLGQELAGGGVNDTVEKKE